MVEVYVSEVVEVTDSDVLINVDGMEYWVLRSHLHEEDEDVDLGFTGDIRMKEWIAVEKGIV